MRDGRIHDVLTEMYLYALVLDAERERLDGHPSRKLDEELAALRETTAALRQVGEEILRPIPT